MTLPVYPGPDLIKGLAYSSKWTPAFFNLTATTATGAELDIGLAQYPLHSFELNYKFLRDGPGWGGVQQALEFRTMMGFFLAMQGSLGRCLYRNPDDHQTFQDTIATGDGTTTTFTLTRGFGANGYLSTEPVGQVDTNQPFNAYLAGSATPLAPTAYTVSTANPCANTITFTSAPGAGVPIAVDMTYFYYCKLAGDTLSFDKFKNRLWALEKVQLKSCRAGT